MDAELQSLRFYEDSMSIPKAIIQEYEIGVDKKALTLGSDISTNRRRDPIIRCQSKDMFYTQCDFCPKRYELCWMYKEDHVKKCGACRELAAQALQDSIAKKEHEVFQRDLDIEATIAQEALQHSSSSLSPLQIYEDSLLQLQNLHYTSKATCGVEELPLSDAHTQHPLPHDSPLSVGADWDIRDTGTFSGKGRSRT